ncbi:MAG: DUF262 domain-containing protein [Gaiellaceae bacterium]
MAGQRLTALFAEVAVPLLYHHTFGQAHVEDWTPLVSTGSVLLESSPMHSEATSRFVDHLRRVEAQADSERREVDDPGSLKILTVGDIEGDFFVPAYQRGYRWTEYEVGQLLEDIRDSNGTTYYLQPVVVKGRNDDSWELVDGQQRLTTLYLIFQYLARTHLPSVATSYTITYETREGSKDYLDQLGEADADSNIDYFHMFHAYRCIEEWFAKFEHRTTHEATRLYGYLFDSVKVLWYEAPADVDSTNLFTRLNVGRIPLTDAERRRPCS